MSRELANKPGWVEIALGLLGLAGLADSILLTIEHYTALTLPCTFAKGCETVLTSRFATVGPLPTAALGIVFYGLILFAAIYAFTHKMTLPRLPLLIWSSLGLISSLGLTYVQAFIIRAWCQYCLLSGLSSLLIFVVAAIAYILTNKSSRKNNDNLKQEDE